MEDLELKYLENKLKRRRKLTSEIYRLDSSNIKIFSVDDKDLLLKTLNKTLEELTYSSKGEFKLQLEITTTKEVK